MYYVLFIKQHEKRLLLINSKKYFSYRLKKKFGEKTNIIFKAMEKLR